MGGGNVGLEVILEGFWFVFLSLLGSFGKFLGIEMICFE